MNLPEILWQTASYANSDPTPSHTRYTLVLTRDRPPDDGGRLLAPTPPWVIELDGYLITDPCQQWWDLLDLGGKDRCEAADRLRSAILGGVAVMLHIQRLGLDLPLRATGDARFGVPPHLLRSPELVDAIEAVGYQKVAGNRRERPIDERRVASVDLLIPTYRSRARDTVKVGSIVTSEVPGLAEAFQRPGVNVEIDLRLTNGETLSTAVTLPDAVGMLALKTLVRTVRTENRDVEDLWRFLEIATAEGVEPTTFESSESQHDSGPGCARPGRTGHQNAGSTP